jgi:hypothetical protein
MNMAQKGSSRVQVEWLRYRTMVQADVGFCWQFILPDSSDAIIFVVEQGIRSGQLNARDNKVVRATGGRIGTEDMGLGSPRVAVWTGISYEQAGAPQPPALESASSRLGGGRAVVAAPHDGFASEELSG